MARESKRERHDHSRRQSAQDRRTAAGRTAQERAQIQREIDRQLSPWTPRRIAAWSLFAAAFLIGMQHGLAHLGFAPLPISMGWQDLLIGYPAAGLLAIVGAFALDPRPHRQ